MFKNEFRVKSSAPLKGAEQKKLKATICKHFSIADNVLDEFLSHKQLSQLKAITHANDIVKIYCAQDVAIVFDYKGKFYPTIFMVWSFLNIVPRLMIDKNGKSRLKSTAELTIKDLTSVNSDHLWSSLAVDQCVCLYTNTCQKVIAVGYMMMSGNTMKEHENVHDKCLKVLHCHDDELFKTHILNTIPNLIAAMEREYNAAPEINDDEPTLVEDALTDVEKMDLLLMTCSLKALKHSITNDMLPILASTFYKKYVMSFCPEGTELDIKKTSFKKLSTFLQLLNDDGIIKLNVGSNGIVEITRINHTNCKFEDKNLDIAEKNVDQFSPPVKETYIVTPGLHPIFSEFLCRKGDELSVQSIRKYVTEYIKKYELQDSSNPSTVNTNDVLKKILSQRKDKSSITIKELIEEITKLMHRTEISVLDTDNEPKKSLKKKINHIEMTVNNRSGNKKVTLVNNLELYGIDIIKFSKECQHGVAASTTINDVPNAQNRQLQIQGSQVLFVYKLLTDQYKIPVKFIRGHENFINKKQKK